MSQIIIQTQQHLFSPWKLRPIIIVKLRTQVSVQAHEEHEETFSRCKKKKKKKNNRNKNHVFFFIFFFVTDKISYRLCFNSVIKISNKHTL